MSKRAQYLPLDRHFSTKAIHVAYHPDQTAFKSIVPPIDLSTTFHQTDFENLQHFRYSRYGNPNRDILEKTMASLENGKYATCFATGVAAIAMAVHLATPGDHILSIDDVYGGTYKYFTEYCPINNISCTFADLTKIENVEKFIKPNTKIVWLECLTNPLMEIVDIIGVSQKVKELNPKAYVVVDSSFLSPFFVRPLDLGAHISLSSLTKYINGHSDVLMGALVTNDEDVHKIFVDFQGGIGAVPSPFDCSLALRGLRTLAVRMRQHMCSGYKMAKFLETHPMVEKVLYAGLPTHPGHEIALKQWSGCSGMLSFYIKGDIKDTKKFLNNLTYVSTCQSYGGYESVIEVPMTMSQHFTPREELEQKGIVGNFVRLSVGLEDIDDLIGDLKQALDSIKK